MCCRRLKAKGRRLKWFFALTLALSLHGLAFTAQAEDRLYYFWSFSIPEESLKAAFADGEKIGLVAVLRGLPEGPTNASLLRLQQLLGKRKVEVLIDPLLFRLYDITAVPAVVYAQDVNPSCEHCEPAPKHWKAAGDIPLRAAIESLSRSDPSASGGAERHLEKLREGFYSK